MQEETWKKNLCEFSLKVLEFSPPTRHQPLHPWYKESRLMLVQEMWFEPENLCTQMAPSEKVIFEIQQVRKLDSKNGA